jgi:hypothetical protein
VTRAPQPFQRGLGSRLRPQVEAGVDQSLLEPRAVVGPHLVTDAGVDGEVEDVGRGDQGLVVGVELDLPLLGSERRLLGQAASELPQQRGDPLDAVVALGRRLAQSSYRR